jgi:hypothetical protein
MWAAAGARGSAAGRRAPLQPPGPDAHHEVAAADGSGTDTTRRAVSMDSIESLMARLDGADAETVNRIAWEHGSLPVRLAMLGLASRRKAHRPLWWGYPPGVFISYKWDGPPMRALALDLAAHVRALGYRAYLDVENLDADADAYFQIPQFIASLQDCTFYLLLLTELSADLMSARKGKTTWIHDEYQHAVRLTNAGRLVIVPVLLEPGGMMPPFTPDRVIDLTRDRRDFAALHAILTPAPLALAEPDVAELAAVVARFDAIFLSQQWAESDALLRRTAHFGHTFDHQFRRMLHAMYTADQAGLDAALARLHAVYGEGIVLHLYRGYCAAHGIPNRATVG